MKATGEPPAMVASRGAFQAHDLRQRYMFGAPLLDTYEFLQKLRGLSWARNDL